MPDQTNRFRRFRETHLHGWEATCTEGTAMSLLDGSPYTVRFDRPKRPNAIPPYEGIDAPAIERAIAVLGRNGWDVKLVLSKTYDPVLKRTPNVLTAIVMRHPGNPKA
jgi:hypothetical protein